MSLPQRHPCYWFFFTHIQSQDPFRAAGAKTFWVVWHGTRQCHTPKVRSIRLQCWMQQTPWQLRVWAACRSGTHGRGIDAPVLLGDSKLATIFAGSCPRTVAMDLECSYVGSTSTAAHPSASACAAASISIALERVAYGTSIVAEGDGDYTAAAAQVCRRCCHPQERTGRWNVVRDSFSCHAKTFVSFFALWPGKKSNRVPGPGAYSLFCVCAFLFVVLLVVTWNTTPWY